MTDEIKAIIEKNLPAQVGETLKQVLEQAKKDSETVKQQSERIETLLKTVKEKESIISDYVKFDQRNLSLDNRENELSERERNLKITILENQLSVEKEKSEFAKSIGLGLVRNTEFRKNVFDSENQSPYCDSNNVWHNPMPVNKHLSEQKSAE